MYPQDPLLRVQEVLNGTEVNLQHLTALVDCRSLHLVRARLLELGLRQGGSGTATEGDWGQGRSWRGRLGAGGCSGEWGLRIGLGAQPSLESSSGEGGSDCCELGQAQRVHLTLPSCPSRPQDYVQALTGFCYDGVEGLVYLALFSFVTALMFSSVVCSVPHTWQQKR